MSDVQPWEYSGNKKHPIEKALSVLEPLFRSFSRPADLILDAFAGSGSTLVAAAFNGHRYLGIEIEANKRVAIEEFQVWTLSVGAGNTASLKCDDGSGNVVFSKNIGFTDSRSMNSRSGSPPT